MMRDSKRIRDGWPGVGEERRKNGRRTEEFRAVVLLRTILWCWILFVILSSEPTECTRLNPKVN